jgi:hypothetical protein
MMPSWCRQVNWGNCGITWVNYEVLCVKDDWKGQFWGLRDCLSKLRSSLSFPSGMTSHSKIAQFNWQFIARLRHGIKTTNKGYFFKGAHNFLLRVWKYSDVKVAEEYCLAIIHAAGLLCCCRSESSVLAVCVSNELRCMCIHVYFAMTRVYVTFSSPYNTYKRPRRPKGGVEV